MDKEKQEKTVRELAMDTYEDILHAEMQVAMVQKHIPHLYPKLYEECERAHAGISHALNLSHKVLSAATNADKAPAGKSEDDGLARTLLSWVDRNRKELREMSRDATRSLFSTLLDDIEELCKWQIGDPRRAIFTIGLEYGEDKWYSDTDRECGNVGRALEAREKALQEAAARAFLNEPRSTRFHSLYHQFEERLPGYIGWKYIWHDIRPKHIDWLGNAHKAGFINSLIIDYEPEQEK